MTIVRIDAEARWSDVVIHNNTLYYTGVPENLDADAFEQTANTLAQIDALNPQKIVIAGEITEADKVLLPAIESCINTQALKAFRHNLPVVRSTLDHRSAIGAFALVKRAMLNGTLLQRLLES